MNYQNVYDRLIHRARNRVSEGYTERHHIVPRCMGGGDEETNIVRLYPEEHFTAHVLLLKIFKHTPYRHALAKACLIMRTGHKGRRVNRKLYGWLRREIALSLSISQGGERNSQFGSRWVNNGHIHKKIQKEKEIPDGWVLGRIKKEKVNNKCVICQDDTGSTRSLYCKGCRSMVRSGVAKKSFANVWSDPGHKDRLIKGQKHWQDLNREKWLLNQEKNSRKQKTVINRAQM